MIGAESQVGTLAWCFLAAVVVVSPFGYRQVRMVRRHRAGRAPRTAPAAEPTPPEDDRDLATALSLITADARARRPGAEFVVTIPVVATLGGRPADRAIVESIVADSLRRDGIDIIERSDDGWRCRRPDVVQ
jgi:hypothetical protein